MTLLALEQMVPCTSCIRRFASVCTATLAWRMSRFGPYMPMQRSERKYKEHVYMGRLNFWHMGPLNFYRQICTLILHITYFDDHTAPAEKTPQNEVPKRKDVQMQHRFWPSMHRCCTTSLFSITEENRFDFNNCSIDQASIKWSTSNCPKKPGTDQNIKTIFAKKPWSW